jgi:hypothetical protein
MRYVKRNEDRVRRAETRLQARLLPYHSPQLFTYIAQTSKPSR